MISGCSSNLFEKICFQTGLFSYQIASIISLWKRGRAVEGGALEKRYTGFRYQRFESSRFRQNDVLAVMFDRAQKLKYTYAV